MDGYDFTEHILYTIFLKSPVISLSRCQWVSETWFDLITSGDFKADHYRQTSPIHGAELMVNFLTLCSLQKNGLDIDWDGSEEGEHVFVAFSDQNLSVPTHLPWPVIGIGNHPSISGVINGIVCVHDKFLVLLWNPAIRKYKLVPEAPTGVIEQRSVGVIEQHSVYNFDVCFGFDNKTNDFKIVRYLKHGRFPQTEMDYFHVYSLRSDRWRYIPGPGAYGHDDVDDIVYCCGAYYWLMKSANNYLYILCLDLGLEVFHEIPFPGSTDNDLYQRLLSLENSLVLVQARYTEDDTLISMWVRNENHTQGSGWTYKYKFSLDGELRPLFLMGNRIFFKYCGTHDEGVICDSTTKETMYYQFELGSFSIYTSTRRVFSYYMLKAISDGSC